MCTPNQFNLNEAASLGINGPTSLVWLPQSNASQGPIQPQPMDILCGKSKLCVDHGGSRRFRTVIECYREQYQQALTKWDKTSVTRAIYDNLSQAGSRFLKYNEKLKIWEEVTPMAARDKIGHALRFANRTTRRKRGANCIGESPVLSGIKALLGEPAKEASTPMPQPMQAQALPSIGAQTEALTQAIHMQLPALSFVSTLSSSSPAQPQLVQEPPKQQPMVSTPTLIPASTPAETGPPSNAVLEPIQGLLTQSVLPLNRSSGWYQNTDTAEEDTLKKPTSFAGCASLDDSLSLLEGILPLNQDVQIAKPANELSFDLDFDAEILSVLF